MSDYVRVRDYDLDQSEESKPRYLTEAEIDTILADFPRIEAADEDSANVAMEDIKGRFRREMRAYKLTPLGLAAFRHKLITFHLNSGISPGSPVGLITAMSISSEFTQMTLNTFHFSWRSVSAAVGIDNLERLIYARTSERSDVTYMYLKDHFTTLESALQLRAQFVGSTVEDFIVSRVVLQPDALNIYWWTANPQVLTNDTRLLDAISSAKHNNHTVLRIKLNTVEMSKHRVTMADIGKVIARENKNLLPLVGPFRDATIDIYIIGGWSKEVKYAKETYRGNTANEFRNLYFQLCVRPSFKNMLIKGIKDITRVIAVVIKVMSMVKKEVLAPFAGPDGGKVWIWTADSNMMKYKGMELAHLTRLALASGCETSPVVANGETVKNQLYVRYVSAEASRRHPARVIIGATDSIIGTGTDEATGKAYGEYLLVYQRQDPNMDSLSPDDRAERKRIIRELGDNQYRIINEVTTPVVIQWTVRVTTDIFKPTESINNLLIYERRSFQRTMALATTKLVRAGGAKRLEILATNAKPRPAILQLAEYVYLSGAGTNMSAVLAHPLIDSRLATCTNVHKMAQYLGIEAARFVFIRELNDTINATGANIHPIHLQYYGDFVTTLDKPLGATFAGISRQPIGHFALASVQQSGNVFKRSATIGQKESANNVSASVATGKRMAMGTGAFQIVYVKQTTAGPVYYFDDQVYTAHQGDIALDERNRILNERLSSKRVDDGGTCNLPGVQPTPYYPALLGVDDFASIIDHDEIPHPSSICSVDVTQAPIITTGLEEDVPPPLIGITSYSVILSLLEQLPTISLDPLTPVLGGTSTLVRPPPTDVSAQVASVNATANGTPLAAAPVPTVSGETVATVSLINNLLSGVGTTRRRRAGVDSTIGTAPTGVAPSQPPPATVVDIDTRAPVSNMGSLGRDVEDQ